MNIINNYLITKIISKLMKLAFVIPGWYVKNSTINSDVKETIRVIGGVEERPDYFKLSDGTELSEYEILNYWTFMNTAPTNKETLKVEVDDIKHIEEVKKEIPKSTKTEEINIIREEVNSIPINNSNNIIEIVETPKKSENEIFIDKLLENVIEINDFEIEIPIKFSFKYNINKLKQIISLINNDDNKIKLFIDKIISNQKNKINNRIQEKLIDYLLKPDVIETNKDKEIINQKTRELQTTNSPIVNYSEPTLLEEITETTNISKYLNKIL